MRAVIIDGPGNFRVGSVPDPTPQPDEVVIIICLANRGRLNARVGGLKFEQVKGEDGLM